MLLFPGVIEVYEAKQSQAKTSPSCTNKTLQFPNTYGVECELQVERPAGDLRGQRVCEERGVARSDADVGPGDWSESEREHIGLVIQDRDAPYACRRRQIQQPRLIAEGHALYRCSGGAVAR